ncbi:hypothetical protein [Faecalispora jeddahensis]|uniref:hypothetical protein n=1 Tax=Faecalispora jeddahensis TaxID=1414721 RepID=UPI00189B4436|nr:hypothetical protein [Faecalispora jeddahensis]
MEDNTTMNTNPVAGEKTFSQDDVNRIVGERLAKEKAKGEATLAEREQQLAQRELLLTAKEKINEMGLPADLVDALNVSSPEALDKALNIVKIAFAKHKSEAQPIKIVGAAPADSSAKAPGATNGNDPSLRKAMGLPK